VGSCVRVPGLWALRGDAAPEPAGLLAPAGSGAYAAQLATLARVREVTAFAVSIEPAGGSKSPTGPIVLVGAVRG
jgi:anti-sigma-K factor RskA